MTVPKPPRSRVSRGVGVEGRWRRHLGWSCCPRGAALADHLADLGVAGVAKGHRVRQVAREMGRPSSTPMKWPTSWTPASSLTRADRSGRDLEEMAGLTGQGLASLVTHVGRVVSNRLENLWAERRSGPVGLSGPQKAGLRNLARPLPG